MALPSTGTWRGAPLRCDQARPSPDQVSLLSPEGERAERSTLHRLQHRSSKVGDSHALFAARHDRSEEHTSELQSLMRISYAVFCLKKKLETQHMYKRVI